MFSIAPQGYLHQLDVKGYKPTCLIGIESIPDSQNQYRLGLTFLKNFYMALDFENNHIMIGVNNNGPSKFKDISTEDEFNKNNNIPDEKEEEKDTSAALWVVIILLVLVIAGVGFKRYREIKQEK